MNGVTFIAICCVLHSGWATAQSPAGSDERRSGRLDLSDIASEIIGRADSNSQVLSLNLTNLVILLVLKGLLFGATYWSGGHHGYGYGHGYAGGHKSVGRELGDSPEAFVTETEAMLVASYLMGDASQNFDCLYRVACQDPSQSKKYLDASKVLLKGSKLFPDVLSYDKKYETLVSDFQEAVNFGKKYGTCEQRYTCDSLKSGKSTPT